MQVVVVWTVLLEFNPRNTQAAAVWKKSPTEATTVQLWPTDCSNTLQPQEIHHVQVSGARGGLSPSSLWTVGPHLLLELVSTCIQVGRVQGYDKYFDIVCLKVRRNRLYWFTKGWNSWINKSAYDLEWGRQAVSNYYLQLNTDILQSCFW